MPLHQRMLHQQVNQHPRAPNQDLPRPLALACHRRRQQAAEEKHHADNAARDHVGIRRRELHHPLQLPAPGLADENIGVGFGGHRRVLQASATLQQACAGDQAGPARQGGEV